MATAPTEPDDVDDASLPGTNGGTPAPGTTKTWKDLLGISFKFNSHVNAAYKNVHDALNDSYADTLDRRDLEPLFTNASFTALK